MADKRISELPLLSTLSDAALLPVEQNGVASAVSGAVLKSALKETAISENGAALRTIRTILTRGVYTGDVSALLAELDLILDSDGTGGDGSEEPDEPVVPPDEPEVVTEELTPVFAQNYPDRKTFAYTEVNGSAVDDFWSYVVFKRSNVRGGQLQIDLDTTRWTGYRALIYVFDSTGAPYLHLSMGGTDFITDPIITANHHVSINEIGSAIGGWIHINLPSVTYEVPAGCSVMVCITGISGTSTEILDESLIMDTPTGKRYKLYDAIIAGEVLTAKVVGGVSNG